MKQLLVTSCALILSAFLLTSCSSRESVIPGEEFQQAIKGRWNLDYLPLEALGKSRKSNFITPKKIKSGFLNNSNLRLSSSESYFIEFLENDTFVLSSGENTIYGTYKTLSETSVSLENIGVISDILIQENQLRFKISFEGNQITISGNKAKEVPLSERTKLLTRKWSIDLKQFEIDNGEKLDEEFDRVEVLFSTYGTYLVMFYSENTLVEAETANWKWMDTKEDKFYYWWEDEDENYSYVTITELSSKKLVITETFEEENESYRHVLYPVN